MLLRKARRLTTPALGMPQILAELEQPRRSSNGRRAFDSALLINHLQKAEGLHFEVALRAANLATFARLRRRIPGSLTFPAAVSRQKGSRGGPVRAVTTAPGPIASARAAR
jgi:hypothetical protein